MKKIIVLLISFLFLLGCASTKLTKVSQKVSLGSSLEEVIKMMGGPTLIRGVVQNRYDEVVEVLEYSLTEEEIEKQLSRDLLVNFGLMPPSITPEKKTQNYWLYFVNDELVKLGEVTNWKKEAKKIYNVRFKAEK